MILFYDRNLNFWTMFTQPKLSRYSLLPSQLQIYIRRRVALIWPRISVTLLWVIASTVIHNIQQPIYISNKTFTVWLLYVFSQLSELCFGHGRLLWISDCINNCIIICTCPNTQVYTFFRCNIFVLTHYIDLLSIWHYGGSQ